VENAKYYDVNSLYPYIMLKREFPLGRPIYKESKILDDYYGVCYAKINTNNGNVSSRGILPYRFNNMLTTPNGEFKG